MIDLEAVINAFPFLMQGLMTTLYIFGVAIVLGFIIGLVVAFMRITSFKPIQWIAKIYVDIIRGTPLLVQIFFIYFGLNSLSFISLEREIAGILTIAINAGAYLSENIRAGIQSIEKGQTEASRSLGFSGTQTMFYVILPQALRRMLPTFTNQAIITLKDTSLLSVIGIADLTQKGEVQASATFQAFPMWTAVGIIYFVVIYILTLLSNYIERRYKLR